MDIVIVTFNRARYLKKCLSALLATVDAGDCILTVDNNSTDDTRQVWEKHQSQNVVYWNPGKNLACAGGRNRGVEWFHKILGVGVSDGDYIAMFDDDVKVCPGWKAAAIDVLEAQPRAGVVALFNDFRRVSIVAEHTINGHKCLEKTFINTGACVVRRKAFVDVGGYRESGRALDWISTQFCKDLQAKNWQIFVLPNYAENMDHPFHPDNEREFYRSTGYEAFRKEGKKRRVQLGDEGKFFNK